MVATSLINKLFSLAIIISQISIIFLFMLHFFGHGSARKLWSFIRRKAFKLSFVLVLFSIFISLYYSEIAHYQPCLLCWIQRILLFPQILIVGIAWLKDYKKACWILLPLNILGLGVASYHYIIQIFPSESLTCTSNGTSCSFYQFMNYGYITIPMMTITLFLMLTILSIAMMPKRK